jgi:hypothetical protein
MKHALILVALVAMPAAASAPSAWAELDRKEIAACTAAAIEIKAPQVGPAVRFSDAMGIDVRDVSGTYKPRHMNGAKARQLCAYDRRSGKAEVTDRPKR